jgi:putative ABC transport system ATP-binding protein
MIEIRGLKFEYGRSEFKLAINELAIDSGEKIAIVGPSGSGKTTLLNLVAGIVVPSKGSVIVEGNPISDWSDARRRNFRIARIGMVFQQFELVEYLNVLDNILLPYWINSSLNLTHDIRRMAIQSAERMGLGNQLKRRPHQLSQGEQQRVAICRAAINRPQLILADEPTGNLDPTNKSKILRILFQECDERGQTMLVVTHDQNIVSLFDRVIDFEEFHRQAISVDSLAN